MPVNPNPASLISEDGVICVEIRDRDTKKATLVKFKESDFENWFKQERKILKTLFGISNYEYSEVQRMIVTKEYRNEKNKAFETYSQYFGIKLMMAHYFLKGM